MDANNIKIEKQPKNINRTEEVQDIIDRMPRKTGRIVSIFVIFFTVVLLFFGWLIEYPEIVTGSINITARHAPVKLVGNASGKIHLLKKNREYCYSGEILAMIDNSADLESVMNFDSFLNDCSIDILLKRFSRIKIPKNKTLGELNSSFYNFINCFTQLRQFDNLQIYTIKQKALQTRLNTQNTLYELSEERVKVKSQSMLLASNMHRRDSLLFISATIAEQTMEQSTLKYISLKDSKTQLDQDIENMRYSISNIQNQMELLQTEKIKDHNDLKNNLISAYNQLKGDIQQWKLRYTIVAPYDGTIEYLNFWQNNDFISSGTELISIIPNDNNLLGYMYLPAYGAGKVKLEQEVIIKLDDYPFYEFGSVKGIVKNISQVTSQSTDMTNESNISTYLITVDLPKQITTNYGAELDFRLEMKGVADIITKKQRLIHRLFGNLKYKVTKK